MRKLLLLAAVLGLPVLASAQVNQWAYERLLTGTNLNMPSAITNTWADTNMLYERYVGVQTYLLPAGTSNAVVVGRSAPLVLSFTQTNFFLYASSNGTIVTNYQVVNTNSPVAPSAFQPTYLWADANANPIQFQFGINASTTNGVTAAATNTITVTLASVNNGQINVSNQLAMTFAFNTATNIQVQTNLPTTFTQGNQGIQVYKIGNGTGTNTVINDLWVGGFKPAFH